MTEQLTNALVTPSATLVTTTVTAGTTTTFTVAWGEPSPPTTGTYTLLFKGAADDGSDDSLFRVSTMSSATVISGGSWEKVGAQATFTTGAELELDHSKAALQAVVSEGDALSLLKASNLSDLADAATARTNLGLGTAALVADSGLVHIAGTETLTGVKIGPNGSASATTWAARATGNGMYSSAASTLDLAAAGTRAVGITSSQMTVQSTRELVTAGGITISNRLALGVTFPVSDLGSDLDPLLAADITSTSATSFTVDQSAGGGGGPFNNTTSIRTFIIDSEKIIGSISGDTISSCIRGAFGTTAATHTAGATVTDYDGGSLYNNWIVPSVDAVVHNFANAVPGNVTVWLPPSTTIGVLAAPTKRWAYVLAFNDLGGFTVTIKRITSATAPTGQTIDTLTGASGVKATVEYLFDTSALEYVPIARY